ncbi:MAG TPA: DUF2085 domain-containing protein [Herpetosiphonaceae bacterium]
MTEDELNKRVLSRATREVEDRKRAREQAVIVQQPRQPLAERDERPALWGFIALAAALVIGGLFLLPGTFVEKLNWTVHGVCAQEHKLYLGGVSMPLCQRNTGLYSGVLATLLTLLLMGRSHASKLPPRPILLTLLAGIAWMGVDGFNSLFLDMGAPHLYEPQPVLRILSGLAMGMAVGTFLLFAINASLRSDPRRDQRIIGGWREYGLLALANLLIFVLIRLGGVWVLYPLAIFSTLGIFLVMFTVNLLVIAMVGNYENAVRRMVQLAAPAMGALVLTAVEFGLLAWARMAIESATGA